MRSKRRIEITLTARQTLVVRRSMSAARWCTQCARPSRMILPDEAALLSRISARAIYRLIEGGEIHFVENDSGLVFVCLDSLSAAMPL